jgi:Ran GTPase-activating protein (RanGAP) involved in mRNA processing and transport
MLATLGGAPALESLCLDLVGNDIADIGAAFLTTLKRSDTLHTLRLDLTNNLIGTPGAQSLATLGETPALRILFISLRLNCIGTEGAIAFSRLGCSKLRELYLNFNECWLRNAAARSLVALRDSRSLQILHLNIGGNWITNLDRATDRGVCHLRTLYFDMGNNRLGDTCAMHLANSMKNAPVLDTLHLSLGGNHISDASVTALCSILRDMPALCDLHLDLSHNPLDTTGVSALADLKRAFVRCNILSSAGGEAILPPLTMAHSSSMYAARARIVSYPR